MLCSLSDQCASAWGRSGANMSEAKTKPIPQTDEEWNALPPLVGPGSPFGDMDREAVLSRIVYAWTTPSETYSAERYVDAAVRSGTFKRHELILERLRLVDESGVDEAGKRTTVPIDLGELLRRVEERLSAFGSAIKRKRSYLFIQIDTCLLPLCDCSERKIRPAFRVTRSKFAASADFTGTTFAEWADFSSSSFAREAYFSQASFGKTARFPDASFSDVAGFLSTSFGGWADFTSAWFTEIVNFTTASFADRATFQSASFGGWAVFSSASFADLARFSSASFANLADFSSTAFAGAAHFSMASFAEIADFEHARFASGRNLADAQFGSRVKLSLFGWRRMARDLKQAMHWGTVRAVGSLQILTKASYIMLIVVPALAAAWPSVQRMVHGYNEQLVESRRLLENAKAELDTTLKPLESIPATSKPAATLKDTSDDLAKRAKTFVEHLGPVAPPQFPWDWVLAYVAAIAVALGQIVYQARVPERVRAEARDNYAGRRRREFIEARPEEKRDRLVQAVTHLQDIAGQLPEFRSPNLLRREATTIWFPENTDKLVRIPTTEQEQELQRNHALDVQAKKADGVEPPKPLGSLMHTRDELEPILVEEGAKAEYDLRTRDNMPSVGIAIVSYFIAMVAISWLVIRQFVVVACQAQFKFGTTDWAIAIVVGLLVVFPAAVAIVVALWKVWEWAQGKRVWKYLVRPVW